MSEDVNEEEWTLVSRVFQAVVDSFVAGDKAKCQMVDERNLQEMTYAGVMANLQALQNFDQRLQLRKESVVNVSNPQLTVPKFVEANAEDTHGSFFITAEVRR